MRIDSHQHFWKYQPEKDAWITEDMHVIRRDFMPPDLSPLLRANGIDGCVAVQADQSERETEWLLRLAEENDFIKGVVGWIDLQADNLAERLDYFSQFKKLKGFRHIAQAEPRDDFLLGKDFCQGIGMLSAYQFTYDILIFPRQLPYALELVRRFPQQPFVVDHLAKPDFKKGDFAGWEKGIREMARHQHVFCKVSGMVTEADWHHWKDEDFNYCLDVVTAAFGTDRLMFGSDWPVCLLASSYRQVCTTMHRYYSRYLAGEQERIWGGNAIRFYHLQ